MLCYATLLRNCSLTFSRSEFQSCDVIAVTNWQIPLTCKAACTFACEPAGLTPVGGHCAPPISCVVVRISLLYFHSGYCTSKKPHQATPSKHDQRAKQNTL